MIKAFSATRIQFFIILFYCSYKQSECAYLYWHKASVIKKNYIISKAVKPTV